MGFGNSLLPHTHSGVFVILLAALLAPVAAPAGATGRELADLSLEELMQVRLGTMSITGIEHTHDRHEVMIGLVSMLMHMDGNRSGTSSRSQSDVLDDYMVTPTDMTMQMHMLHLMYAPFDRLTLMLMLPYERVTMHHKTRMGAEFNTSADGIGDIELSGLFDLWRDETQRIVLTGGFTFPSGSIDEVDETPMGRVRLPYPMQLGSGSVDLLPGVTYLGQRDRWAWGVRAAGTIRLHENENHYRLGNRAQVMLWGARQLTDWLSGSLRLDGQLWTNIHGADPQLDPALVPTADPNRRRGQRLDLLFGVNVFQVEGPLAGNRLRLEGGLPVYQWLDGPQLETDWILSASWDWTF